MVISAAINEIVIPSIKSDPNVKLLTSNSSFNCNNAAAIIVGIDINIENGKGGRFKGENGSSALIADLAPFISMKIRINEKINKLFPEFDIQTIKKIIWENSSRINIRNNNVLNVDIRWDIIKSDFHKIGRQFIHNCN